MQTESGVRTFVRFEFPLTPTTALDPTAADWTLNLFDTPELITPPNKSLQVSRRSVSKTYTFTRGNWTSPEAGKYVYSGAAGAVTASVDQRTFILEATGAEAFVNSSSATPKINALSVILNVGGSTYYTLFGGKVWANTDTTFKAHSSLLSASSGLSKPLSTTTAITDLTTGQPALEPLQSNLKSAIVLPNGIPGDRTQIDIAVPDGCYSVEFLFSEIDPAVNTTTNPRRFFVTAAELGVNDALVSIQQQLGGSNLYYPGAYTASGPVRDGFISITFTRVDGDPIINGFIITPLTGCSGTPDPPNNTPIVIDLGGQTLPEGVYIYKAP